ncbi:putative thiol peroxidase [Reticulibacter mediterranei]|uniref:Putative thiol peroxidase n=1 Tax=Reticulibacter mediterranei TaxID=2778369 RepID=A0A8J3IF20_9CHLR|nr:redoxin domain-containing protein [Reticulibacter mediterranei]GHO90004.1 putative thiol peroxidase [Reticulibacter mediterranei]
MHERWGEAFAQQEQLTVIGEKLQTGVCAPDFTLDYVDLLDMAVHCVQLADTTGTIRILSVINSLDRAICRQQTRRWEALCLSSLSPDVCLYTISMDSPQMHFNWQGAETIFHQTLSAHNHEQFGRDYGLLLKEWHLLQRAVLVIDRNDRIAYAEYVADQYSEPDYDTALHVILQIQQ